MTCCLMVGREFELPAELPQTRPPRECCCSAIREPPAGTTQPGPGHSPGREGAAIWGAPDLTLDCCGPGSGCWALPLNTQNAVRPGLTGTRVGKHARSGFHVQVRERPVCDRPLRDATRSFKGRALIDNDGSMDRVRSCCWPL